MQFKKKHISKEIIMNFIWDLFEYLMYWVERIAPYFICFWIGFILAQLIRL